MAESEEVTIITSFTQKGFDEYGKRFLETWRDNGPTHRLIVYFEGNLQPAVVGDEEVTSIQKVVGHDEFMGMLRFPMMHGNVLTEQGPKYNINWDARMCRKTLMLMHTLQTVGGKVFWIDSDMVVHAKVPDEFFHEVLPDDILSCYLGRHHYDMYTESGFLGVNGNHPHAESFRTNLWNSLFSGLVFNLKGWHDCYLYDFVREHFPEKDFNNLGEGIPKTRGLHPFVNSVLGKYFDHLKGGRKKSGKSSKHDLVAPRDEAYWRGPAGKRQARRDTERTQKAV